MTLFARAFAFLALPLMLAACGSNHPRYLIEPPASEIRVTTAARSIMLRTVSLPDYASADDIPYQEADGGVRMLGSALWADLPPRGMTLALARQLDASVSATVAPEPWPLGGLPDAEIDIRLDRSLAGADGQFRLSGVFYVLAEGLRMGPAAVPFDIAVPLAGSAPGDIARAQSAALARLAEIVARSIGR